MQACMHLGSPAVGPYLAGEQHHGVDARQLLEKGQPSRQHHDSPVPWLGQVLPRPLSALASMRRHEDLEHARATWWSPSAASMRLSHAAGW